MEISQVELYVNTVIPNLERDLSNGRFEGSDLVDAYKLYVDVLRMVAPYNFISYNKYLELDEDHTNPQKAFYHHRKNHLGDVFEAFNEMEIYNMYDMILVEMPPRVGKTTINIRFISWIIGRYPESTQLSTSYSDNITTSFYIGVMEIVQSERYQQVFPDARLVNQNAKREEIWLKTLKRYPTVLFVPINGSMTGRSEGSEYFFCDDLVSGIEEALSIVRLESLWMKYTVNGKQRKKDGCKEIHIATPWSVHDPISRLSTENENNPRCKIIKRSCYRENGESAFDFFGGFSTKYYKELEQAMDPLSFSALYLQEPIEREGLLWHSEDLKYYYTLPESRPDTVIGVVDSKNLGKDYVGGVVAYVYGNDVYIDDIVYDNGLPDVTKPRIAELLHNHKTVRCDIELNNGGNYYAEDVNKLVKDKGGKTTFRIFYSSDNKRVKIITYSDFAKKTFIFKDPSTYSPNSDYAKFMKDLFKWTQTGKNKNDDAPDVMAMLSQLVQDLQGISVKILDRRLLKYSGNNAMDNRKTAMLIIGNLGKGLSANELFIKYVGNAEPKMIDSFIQWCEKKKYFKLVRELCNDEGE